MTRDECKQLLAIIDATYPNFKVANPTETVNIWHTLLGEYEYKVLLMALKTFISTSGSAFAPSVAELIAMTRKPQELMQVSEVDVWREVRKAISRGIYYHEEEFEKLSPMAKKMVGESGQLREWAMLPSEDIDTIVQSNFKKRFETMVKREQELQAMPSEIQNLISNSTKQIGEKNGM